MGCASSIIQPQAILITERNEKRQIVPLQFITPQMCSQVELVVGRETLQSQVEPQIVNTRIRKQKDKIKFLQKSQSFMRESMEISNSVNQAILSLTYNPLLFDDSYFKLLGVNKKTIQKKQNRINNLMKRQQKAQQELKKEKEKRLGKTRSELSKMKNHSKYSKSFINKKENKENQKYQKDQIAFILPNFAKQGFKQKLSKFQSMIVN